MSLLLEASLIALAAFQTKVPCENVFKKLALEARGDIVEDDYESAYLDQLAEAACQTSNPDTIWQIAYTESTFRFRLLRDNRTHKIYTGEEASKYLQTLEKNSRQQPNVDIGVMQINWYWHRRAFDHQPFKMMGPKAQVEYLVSSMGPRLVKGCKTRWLECYHNPGDRKKGARYRKSLLKSRRLLEKETISYLAASLRPIPPYDYYKLPLQKITQVRKLAESELQWRELTYLDEGSSRYYDREKTLFEWQWLDPVMI